MLLCALIVFYTRTQCTQSANRDDGGKTRLFCPRLRISLPTPFPAYILRRISIFEYWNAIGDCNTVSLSATILITVNLSLNPNLISLKTPEKLVFFNQSSYVISEKITYLQLLDSEHSVADSSLSPLQAILRATPQLRAPVPLSCAPEPLTKTKKQTKPRSRISPWNSLRTRTTLRLCVVH